MIIQPFFETKAEVSLAYGIDCPEKQINAFMALQPSSRKIGSQSGCDPKTTKNSELGLSREMQEGFRVEGRGCSREGGFALNCIGYSS